MALGTPTEKAEAILVGWTDPRDYDAGTFAARSGEKVAFSAGTSMRVCIAHDAHGYTELKCRGRSTYVGEPERLDLIARTLTQAGPWSRIEVEFKRNVSDNGTTYELLGVKVLAKPSQS